MDTPAEIQSGISPEIIFLLILLGAVDYTERLGEVTVIFLIPGDSCQAGVGRYSEICLLYTSFFSTAEGVHSYMIWGLGNFSGVSSGQLPVFIVSITAGLVLSVMLIKPLNALLLGNRYAENLGVNVRLTRNLLLLSLIHI